MRTRSQIEPIRDSHGRFKKWPGGRDIKDYPAKWRNWTQHGTRVHIGMEFKKQHNRRPRIGDIVRNKTKNGRYHKSAYWYVYTRYGWSVTASRSKPSTATIKRICANARPTRRR